MIRALLYADALRMARDRFVLGLTLYMLTLLFSMRFAVPWFVALLDARFDFDAHPYLPLFMSYLLFSITPVTPALIGGFLLVDGRQSRVVHALRVTPLSLGSYLRIVGVTLALLGIALMLLTAFIVGAALPGAGALVAACLIASSAGAFGAFFLAARASDSVEALANAKFLSIASLTPLGAYFVPEPWQFLAGVYPGYWACKIYWAANAGEGWLLYAAAGIACAALWVWGLYRALLRAT